MIEIIGIDPAPPDGEVGWVNIQVYDNAVQLIRGEIYCGYPEVVCSKLHDLAMAERKIIVAVEGVQYIGKKKSAFGKPLIETIILIGHIEEVCRICDIPCWRVNPPTHKAATAGAANVKDSEHRLSLENRFGEAELKAAGITKIHTRMALSCAIWLAKDRQLLTI